MNLPFTAAQFFDVFAAYNRATWPAPVAGYILGAAALAFLVRRGPTADRLACGALAAMWLWTGIVYHGLFFARINAAAWAFAILFVAQGLLFLHDGVVAHRLSLAWERNAASIVGLSLVVYAAILYPAIGAATGHEYPRAPMFGVSPCPVAIFTFGMLLMTTPRPPKRAWIIPALWSLIGGSAAFLLGVPQDWPLLASGAIAIPLSVLRPTSAPSDRR